MRTIEIEKAAGGAGDTGSRVDELKTLYDRNVPPRGEETPYQNIEVNSGGEYNYYDDEFTEGTGNIDRTSFTWKLRGENITLKNIDLQDIVYVKRDTAELQRLRNEFNITARKAFLQNLGNKIDYLRKAGFSDIDIKKIQNGRIPDGWQLHHKLPLDDSGSNSSDNLILIKNEPFHKAITNYQNSFSKQIAIGETQTIKWPLPNGDIYPAQH